MRISEEIERLAEQIFVKYADKPFSFVDCKTFAVIEEYQMDAVFAFDEHLRQYVEFLTGG